MNQANPIFIADSMEVKQITTRKLRRRPNDPTPLPEKRRKPSPDILVEIFLMNDVTAHDYTHERHAISHTIWLMSKLWGILWVVWKKLTCVLTVTISLAQDGRLSVLLPFSLKVHLQHCWSDIMRYVDCIMCIVLPPCGKCTWLQF